MSDEKKKFILMGAGPGDPDLITLKGIKILAQADVVLYDALIDKSLLDYAPDAEKIYVGKRMGQHYVSQDEINRIIVEKLEKYQCVVRLKSGDPFIFGRAQDEIDYVKHHIKDVDIEVVPGISSAIGLPSLHQIPLTQRGINESVWIVTGTTAKCELSKDIKLAAQSTTTVVILMGMNQLCNIVEVFKQYRNNDTLVTIIQNGSTHHERKVNGNLHNIIPLTEEHNLKSPAIIIIQNAAPHQSNQ
jgi:uroporphyrin-III C-methyltransferase